MLKHSANPDALHIQQSTPFIQTSVHCISAG